MALKFVIFDLDDTLYPRDIGLMREVGRRIQMWLYDHLGLTWEEAAVRRGEYFRRYGTTLGGLVAEHDVDVHDYLAFVHDVPVEQYLDPDPALAAMLDGIPLRKAIYTNGTVAHARRVLRALDVADHFDHVVGIVEVGLRNKPYRDAYERMLALLDVQGPECVMVEDSERNLQPAKALGLTTVLVDADGSLARAACSAEPGENPGGCADFVVAHVLEVGPVVAQVLSGSASDGGCGEG